MVPYDSPKSRGTAKSRGILPTIILSSEQKTSRREAKGIKNGIFEDALQAENADGIRKTERIRDYHVTQCFQIFDANT